MQTWLTTLAFFLVLTVRAPLEAATPASAPGRAIRVALMTFTTDDNSYRSSLAAADLAAVLQAELSIDTRFQWIERAELKAVEREFELSALGLPDAVGALRRGKITAADWIVGGRFTASNNGPWELTVEVVDVAHADLLAQRRATIPRLTHPTLKSALPQSQVVASEIRAALDASAERSQSMSGRRTVAFLSLLDAEEIEANLARTLEALTNGPLRIRVMQVRQSGLSIAESEMMLLGLVEHDPASWEHLADIYVWGRFVRRDLPALDLTIWDGRGEPQILSISGKPAAGRDSVLSELVPRAAGELARAVAQPGETNRTQNARTRIARALVEQAATHRRTTDRWPRPIENVDAQVKSETRQQIHLLETACFFDPQNQRAHELLLRVGWKASIETYGASNRFWVAFKRCEAWGAYVDRYGLVSISSSPFHEFGWGTDDASIIHNYMWSVLRLVELAQLGNKEDYGFPRDMSGHVTRKWLGAFATDMARRVISTFDQATTRSCAGLILKEGLTGNPMGLMMVEPNLRRRCIEALWPAFVESQGPGSREEDSPELCRSIKATYAELGLAGKEAILLSQLNKPKLPKRQAPVRLPTSAELDRMQRFGPPR